MTLYAYNEIVKPSWNHVRSIRFITCADNTNTLRACAGRVVAREVTELTSVRRIRSGLPLRRMKEVFVNFSQTMSSVMIAKAAAAIRHWEQGNEAGYRGVMNAEAKMKIPAYGLDIAGFDTIWGVRKSMGDGPLAIHAQHTAYAIPRTPLHPTHACTCPNR